MGDRLQVQVHRTILVEGQPGNNGRELAGGQQETAQGNKQQFHGHNLSGRPAPRRKQRPAKEKPVAGRYGTGHRFTDS
ncbi:hypothetical protein GURASL_17370 [Geotalea uraniireducens]|uniref:Uncharacterized protein n=1 Tax=Geotalea uraniireducens TaxID=351604 RepID=A0ABM8EK76_9BACT|nr:hypothetical protein GURASL_17370 [Geotalea uraniireducens]